MGRIKVLDPVTANQIAAGEVIERPASIVKELFENAVDASSSRIEVCFEGGGIQRIKVSDNGVGIAREDVSLAFQRHATSKIQQVDDLQTITTLGFRGEALPSIAAVSRVEMITRTAEDLAGTRLVVSGANDLVLESVGCAPGTSIEVWDLFYNTPARRKYLKHPGAEAAAISDLLERMALARPDIALRCLNGQRLIIQTSGNANLLESIGSIYGLEAARLMVAIDWQETGIRVEGYSGEPSLQRSTRSAQTIIVNGRYVRNAGLLATIEHVYRQWMAPHRHPVAVLHLEIDPEQMDVNVHPSKLEVRFQREQEVRKVLAEALRRALQPGRAVGNQPSNTAAPHSSSTAPGLPHSPAWPVGGGVQQQIFDPGPATGYRNPAHLATAVETRQIQVEGEGSSCWPALEILGQLHDCYLIARGTGGLYLVDQHAAHERVLYEELLATDVAKLAQPLALPVRLECTPAEMEQWRQGDNALCAAGVLLEEFGEKTLLIRTVPVGVPPGAELELVREIMAMVNTDTPVEDKRVRMLATIACHQAIKAGAVLEKRSMEYLLQRLSSTRNPGNCPHGRPTMMQISIEQLQRFFQRT